MKKYKITLGIIIIIIIAGLFEVNLNLNRQIYKSIVSDSNYNDTTYEEYNGKYNLDDMVEVLSCPEKYNVKNHTTIPKIRILFASKPFDFRIDTNKYTFFINKNIKEKFKSTINNKLVSFKTYILHIGKKVKNIVP